jgi:biopolymer transport protein ExbD
MRIEASRRRRRPLSLTSLIDVIFLLLLFFMLSSTFTRFGEVAITGGGASAPAGEPPDVLIRLTADQWSVNGRSFGKVDALLELVRLEQSGAKAAVLMVRGAVSSQQLVAAIEQIRRETGIALSVTR